MLAVSSGIVLVRTSESREAIETLASSCSTEFSCGDTNVQSDAVIHQSGDLVVLV